MSNEYFTKRSTIDEELQHHSEDFRGKTVYCNCDDHRRSNFYAYFKDNFDSLGLKKLITCCIDGVVSITTTDGFEEYTIGDGDFRGEESIKLLEECDVVVTNPPFSLWGDFIRQLREYGKKFLILGSLQSITATSAKEMFLREELWPGRRIDPRIEFEVPATAEKFDREENGEKYMSIVATWFTNLSQRPNHPTLDLTAEYDPTKHKRYDNYDAINVGKIKEIPKDYFEPMGVPVTYWAQHHNPNQFKVLDVDPIDFYLEGKRVYIRIVIQRVV